MPASITLHYGADSTLRIDLPGESLVADCSAPRGAPLDNPLAATATAIAEPLNFPPLARAMVPGDKVVLALGDGVPQAPAIVAAVVQQLLAAGAAGKDITVLRTAEEAEGGENPRGQLPADVARQIILATHDPHDRGQLGYLGVTADDKPIYINRLLLDADLVLPIGCLGLDNLPSHGGPSAALYPCFGDEAAIEHFRAAQLKANGAAKLTAEQSDEVAWRLGVLMTIQVVPGPGDQALHVLAGEPEAVMRRGRQLCEAAWRFQVPQRASLVVATVEGPPGRQTWENVVRAIDAASGAVVDGGSIAVCCELAAEPGPAMQRLARASDPERALRRIRKEKAADSLAATQLFHAVERVKVYLLSQLDEQVVEDLGMAHVDSPHEIARLVARHPSCIVLSNAQHALATADDGGVGGYSVDDETDDDADDHYNED